MPSNLSRHTDQMQHNKVFGLFPPGVSFFSNESAIILWSISFSIGRRIFRTVSLGMDSWTLRLHEHNSNAAVRKHRTHMVNHIYILEKHSLD